MDYERKYNLLKREQEEQRRDEEQRSHEAYEKREVDRKRRQQEIEEEQLYASTWDEAFRKTLPRLRSDMREQEAFNGKAASTEDANEIDHFFQEQVNEHEFARDALVTENAAINPRIQRIRERADRLVAELEQNARDNAAAKTDEKFGKETIIGANLRDNNIDAVVNW